MSEEYNTFKTPEQAQTESKWLFRNIARNKAAEKMIADVTTQPPALRNQMSTWSTTVKLNTDFSCGPHYYTFRRRTDHSEYCEDYCCDGECMPKDPTDRIIAARRSFFQKLKDLFDPTK
jgi:hypothetical protein